MTAAYQRRRALSGGNSWRADMHAFYLGARLPSRVARRSSSCCLIAGASRAALYCGKLARRVQRALRQHHQSAYNLCISGIGAARAIVIVAYQSGVKAKKKKIEMKISGGALLCLAASARRRLAIIMASIRRVAYFIGRWRIRRIAAYRRSQHRR